MFTGLVYKLGIVSNYFVEDLITKVTISCDESSEYFKDVVLGDSICVNGCCLTIISKDLFDGNVTMTYDIMMESLSKTNFKAFKIGDKVHLEKAMSHEDRYNGHMMNGHVMGVIYLMSKVRQEDGSVKLTFSLNNASDILVYKDSVGLDGVSLTISDVSPNSFSVSLIPFTQKHTLLMKNVGSSYNVEFVNVKSDSLVFKSSNISVDYIKHALDLSKKGKYTTYPNPWVGAIIVNNEGEIISEGYHKKKGDKHAEKDALDKVKGMDLKDCTLYCTLEPCNHKFPGKNQPLCTDLIIESGIRKVVIGILDPDTNMKGKAVNILEAAGISVEVLNDTRVARSLRPYITHRQLGRPYIILKSAVSLDGKIALSNGVSKWISGEESRIDSHKLRAKCQAILVGTNTAKTDHPTLNVRLPNNQVTSEVNPLRCFIDLKGVVREGPLMDKTLGEVVVFTGPKSNTETVKYWKNKGLKVVVIKSLQDVLKYLGEIGVLRLLVEGGAKLLTSFIDENLADELILYEAPIILGADGVDFYSSTGLKSINHDKLKLRKIKRINQDVKICLTF